jgi:hypothetical protein
MIDRGRLGQRIVLVGGLELMSERVAVGQLQPAAINSLERPDELYAAL